MEWNDALRGKSAIVTGAGSGIGRATALAYAHAGADVLLVDRDEQRLRETEALADGIGGSAVVHVVDLVEYAGLPGIVEAAVERFGKLDILNNTAGISQPMPFEDYDETAFDRLMAVNTKAVFFLCHAAARHMLSRGDGRIVNVASVGGIMAVPYSAGYCASKAAVVGLTRSLALELSPRGIRVNAICPGFVDTPMTQPYFKSLESEQRRKEVMDAMLTSFLIKRPARPEEIADAAVFLASDASSFITGVILPVDGGWSAW
jgi:NAD(P)-dependent dehydrogenase (short-subunit alcohol dehydrogenase family)